MKPYIVYVKEGPKNGQITLKEKELKDLLEKAYDDGYKDGQRSNYWCYNGGITYANTGPTLTCTDKTVPYKYEVTCDATNAVGD